MRVSLSEWEYESMRVSLSEWEYESRNQSMGIEMV